MNIFKQIKNSVYNKDYYKSVVFVEPFRNSVKYLFKLSLLVALVGSIIFAASTPFIFKMLKSGLSSVVSGYPSDLVISINNGNASINQPEPYFIKAPESMKNIKADSVKIEPDLRQLKIDNLVVINTSEPFSIEKFKEYSTLSLLTQKEIVMMSNNGEIKIVNLSQFGNVDISKDWLSQKEKQSHKVLPWLLIGMGLLVYVGIFIFEFISSIIILLFYALIAWLLLKSKGIEVSYGRAYQVAMHAITLILFMGIIGNVIRPLDNFLLKFVVFGIICYFNFDKLSKPEDQTVVEEDKKIEEKQTI